jgi:hypothetical protein
MCVRMPRRQNDLKVVEMHTWSSDWKRVIIIVISIRDRNLQCEPSEA